MRYTGLSSTAKLAYARLSQYAGESGEAYPAQGTLAAEIGISRRQCVNVLKELEDKHFIKSVVKPDRSSKSYRFLWHEALSEVVQLFHNQVVQEYHNGCENLSQGLCNNFTGVVQSTSHKENHEENHEENHGINEDDYTARACEECHKRLSGLLPGMEKVEHHQMLNDFISDFGVDSTLDALKDMQTRKINQTGVMSYLRTTLKNRETEARNGKSDGRPGSNKKAEYSSGGNKVPSHFPKGANTEQYRKALLGQTST